MRCLAALVVCLLAIACNPDLPTTPAVAGLASAENCSGCGSTGGTGDQGPPSFPYSPSLLGTAVPDGSVTFFNNSGYLVFACSPLATGCDGVFVSPQSGIFPGRRPFCVVVTTMSVEGVLQMAPEGTGRCYDTPGGAANFFGPISEKVRKAIENRPPYRPRTKFMKSPPRA